jgi:hypothetical protein
MLSKQILITTVIVGTVLAGCKKTDEITPRDAPMQAPAPQAAPAMPAPTPPAASIPPANTPGAAPSTPGAAGSASGSASY